MNCSYIFKRSPFQFVFKLWWVQVDISSCHTVMNSSISFKILSKILRNQIIELKHAQVKTIKLIHVVSFYRLSVTS